MPPLAAGDEAYYDRSLRVRVVRLVNDGADAIVSIGQDSRVVPITSLSVFEA